MEDIYSKLPQEKLNIHFSKHILGVSSKSTNIAVMGELGRYPLYIKIISQMLKYYVRIILSKDNTLLAQAMEEMKGLERQGKTTWVTIVEQIVNYLGIKVRYLIQSSRNPIQKIGKLARHKLEERYRTFWKNNISKQTGKLDTYKLLKTDFKYERYLDAKNSREGQIAITRLRISNHRLSIEQGRYCKPIIPREHRICMKCKTEVEDEYHFMFQCPTLAEIRKEHLGEDRITGEKNTLLVKYLAVFEHVTPLCVGKYICQGMDQQY